MNERVEYSQLDCYKRATDEQKRKLNQEQYDHSGLLLMLIPVSSIFIRSIKKTPPIIIIYLF